MRYIRLILVAGVVAGCGGGSGNGGMNTSIYTSVSITPSFTDAYQFSNTPTTLHLTAFDQNNGAMSSAGGTTVWHLSPSGIATVNGSGQIIVSSAMPTLLTISVDLTLQGMVHTSPTVQVQTDIAPLLDQVDAVGNSFSPTTVHIKATGTVNWSGLAADHNVHFSSTTPFGASGISGAPGSSNTATGNFAAAGSFDYQCDIHGPAMHGTVVVH